MLSECRISVKIKGRVYKIVVRPAIMYIAEIWPVTKIQEEKLDVAMMKMLR